MRIGIPFYGDGEVSWFPVTQPVVAGSVTVPVTGYLWWMVMSANLTVDNTLGLANAGYRVQGFSHGQTAWNIVGFGLTSAAGTLAAWYGLGMSTWDNGAGEQVMGLPAVPLIGDGGVTFSLIGGDANTVLTAELFTIVGVLTDSGRRKK